MSDMRHMNHLSAIADGDVQVLQNKEATYQGSWKRAGGRSAWFMMRRNMDRLISMMAQPVKPPFFNLQNVDDSINSIVNETPLSGTPQATEAIFKYLRDSHIAEDVFAKIEENPEGDDGTVLACLRDLRRYLILIEAEMVSRGIVSVEGLKADPKPVATPAPASSVFSKMTHRLGDGAGGKPGTPEDGGHHEKDAVPESEFPWIVSGFDYRMIRERCGSEAAEAFFETRAPGVYRVSTVVRRSTMPSELHGFYHYVHNAGEGESAFVLDLTRCPESVRDEFPKLQREMNVFEYDQSPNDYRFMYDYHKNHLKWILRESFSAYGRE